MSRDLHIVLWDVWLPPHPRREDPSIVFCNGRIDRGWNEFFPGETCPLVFAYFADQSVYNSHCIYLSNKIGRKDLQYDGYILMNKSVSLIEFNFALSADEVVRLVADVEPFVSRSVELSVSLDCTDFIEEKAEDGISRYYALIDGAFGVSISGRE